MRCEKSIITSSFLTFCEENSFSDSLKPLFRSNTFLTIITPRLAPAITIHPARSLRFSEISKIAAIRMKSVTIEKVSILFLLFSENASFDLFILLLLAILSVSLTINHDFEVR